MLDFFFGEEEQLNEHEIAWRTKDWSKVDELAESFAEKSDNALFKVMDEITVNKTRLNVENGVYDKRWVNKALSQHADCLYDAYMMNLIGDKLPDQMHFDYMLGAISVGKRYGKWAKLTEELDQKIILLAIAKFYCISVDDAKFYLSLADDKGYREKLLRRVKGVANDSLINSVTKNQTERRRLKKLVERW